MSQPLATPKESSALRCGYCGVPVTADPVWSTEGEAFCCYGCRVLGAAATGRSKSGEDRGLDRAPWFRIGLGVAIASQAMLVGFAVNLTPPEGPIRLLLHAVLAEDGDGGGIGGRERPDERRDAERVQPARHLLALVVHCQAAVAASGTHHDRRSHPAGVGRRQVDRDRWLVAILGAQRAGRAVGPKEFDLEIGRAHV